MLHGEDVVQGRSPKKETCLAAANQSPEPAGRQPIKANAPMACRYVPPISTGTAQTLQRRALTGQELKYPLGARCVPQPRSSASQPKLAPARSQTRRNTRAERKQINLKQASPSLPSRQSASSAPHSCQSVRAALHRQMYLQPALHTATSAPMLVSATCNRAWTDSVAAQALFNAMPCHARHAPLPPTFASEWGPAKRHRNSHCNLVLPIWSPREQPKTHRTRSAAAGSETPAGQPSRQAQQISRAASEPPSLCRIRSLPVSYNACSTKLIRMLPRRRGPLACRSSTKVCIGT